MGLEAKARPGPFGLKDFFRPQGVPEVEDGPRGPGPKV